MYAWTELLCSFDLACFAGNATGCASMPADTCLWDAQPCTSDHELELFFLFTFDKYLASKLDRDLLANLVEEILDELFNAGDCKDLVDITTMLGSGETATGRSLRSPDNDSTFSEKTTIRIRILWKLPEGKKKEILARINEGDLKFLDRLEAKLNQQLREQGIYDRIKVVAVDIEKKTFRYTRQEVVEYTGFEQNDEFQGTNTFPPRSPSVLHSSPTEDASFLIAGMVLFVVVMLAIVFAVTVVCMSRKRAPSSPAPVLIKGVPSQSPCFPPNYANPNPQLHQLHAARYGDPESPNIQTAGYLGARGSVCSSGSEGSDSPSLRGYRGYRGSACSEGSDGSESPSFKWANPQAQDQFTPHSRHGTPRSTVPRQGDELTQVSAMPVKDIKAELEAARWPVHGLLEKEDWVKELVKCRQESGQESPTRRQKRSHSLNPRNNHAPRLSVQLSEPQQDPPSPARAEPDIRKAEWYLFYRHTVFTHIKSALNQGANSFALVQVKPRLSNPWTAVEWTALQEDVRRACKDGRHEPFYFNENEQVAFEDVMFEQEQVEHLEKRLSYLGRFESRAIIVCSTSEQDQQEALVRIQRFNENNTTLKIKVMTAWATAKDMYREGAAGYHN
eukprot:TRINITY_DN9246_c0_g1_i2.p1 TRINITY_DN9246_c0_g1~~TRINITY_DN9246_c0_g1_i2.p1  ORF type:complete len:618 (+),score=77.76 TRINITY_DN9246_c0_g1_i2:584-2437(+)